MQELILFFNFNLGIKLVAWVSSMFAHYAWMSPRDNPKIWVLIISSLLMILMIADPLLSIFNKENDRSFVVAAYFLTGLFGAQLLMVIAPWLRKSPKKKAFFKKIINLL